jgi:hypothetical protein
MRDSGFIWLEARFKTQDAVSGKAGAVQASPILF